MIRGRCCGLETALRTGERKFTMSQARSVMFWESLSTSCSGQPIGER